MKTSAMRYFIGGFILMALTYTAIRCTDYIGLDEGYGEEEEVIDDSAVKKTAKDIEDAFLSGNPQTVIEFISPTALPFYEDLIESSSADNLKAFGSAFASRSLELLSDAYAEFEFTVGGVNYSVALTATDDGNWYIMRL